MDSLSRRGPKRPHSIIKRFCRQCQCLHAQIAGAITGDLAYEERSALALRLLLRLATLYFLQKADFLEADPDYMRHSLEQHLEHHDESDTYYSQYFLPLLATLLGGPSQDARFHALPQLPLPLFHLSPLEHRGRPVSLPDSAFQAAYDLFDTYAWQITRQPFDTQSLTPVALSCLYERYLNQKEMGAYYTSEDVTSHITSNTLIPYLLDALAKRISPSALHAMLALPLRHFTPSRYLPAALQEPNFLPLETAFEHTMRHARLVQLEAHLEHEGIATPTELVTSNLDARQFLLDALTRCEDVEALLAFYDTLEHLSVLDPTCGCGAFLCAALDLLQALYSACLQRLCAFTTHSRCQELHASVTSSPGMDYFVLHTILTHNLYGIDLLEEATTICQHQLLLALLACAPPSAHQPLPPSLEEHIRSGDILSDTMPAFSWPSFFPQVMARGGFDIVLGNPPYLELQRPPASARDRSRELTYGNLYAEVLQRAFQLSHTDQSYLGLLVPLSLCGSPRFASLRALLRQSSATLWLAHFEIFPCRLFEGAFQRLTLLLARRDTSTSAAHQTYSTRIQRWYASERPHLIELIHYTPLDSAPATTTFLKLAAPPHAQILHTLARLPDQVALGSLLAPGCTPYFVYYQEATNYWTKAVCHIPFYKKNGVLMTPPHGRFLYFPSEPLARVIMAVMNSSLFYAWFATHSDGFHLTHTLVKAFPLPRDLLDSAQLQELALALEHDILRHAHYSTRHTRENVQHTHAGLRIELMEYMLSRSRPLLDQIDTLLAEFYGFTAEELSFLLHYDQKYRAAHDGV